MTKYDFLVVGSGLFGATFASQAKAHGKTVLVLEKKDHVGGLAYTKEQDGIIVHKYGAHIFHTKNKEVWDFINTFGEFLPYVHHPLAFYKGEYYSLPFNLKTFKKIWNVQTGEEAKAKIEEQCAAYGTSEPRNLEEQAIHLVGQDIFNILVKGYTEKQWGRDCLDLPASIINRIPVRFTEDDNYFNDSFQGMPKEGYTALIQNMLSGIEVRTGVDYLEHREEYNKLAKKVIYTGPIDSFFDYSLGKLQYRSLRFEEELIDEEFFQPASVVNYTDSDVPYTRVIEHKRLNPADLSGNHSWITKEYSAEWKDDMEAYYPINDEHNNSLYAQYQELSKTCPNVVFGGRLGEYKYYDMDKTIESALNLYKSQIDG